MHKCHAIDCNVEVHPRFFMCPACWRSLSARLRSEIWRTYRLGQELDKNPSEEYLLAANRAIVWLAEKRGVTDPELEFKRYSIRALALKLEQ